MGILPILKWNLQQFIDKKFQKSKSLTFRTECLTLNSFRLVHNFNVIILLLKLLLDLCQFLFRNFIHVSWITLVVLQVSLVGGLGLVRFPAHFAKHFGRFTCMDHSDVQVQVVLPLEGFGTISVAAMQCLFSEQYISCLLLDTVEPNIFGHPNFLQGMATPILCSLAKSF